MSVIIAQRFHNVPKVSKYTCPALEDVSFGCNIILVRTLKEWMKIDSHFIGTIVNGSFFYPQDGV